MGRFDDWMTLKEAFDNDDVVEETLRKLEKPAAGAARRKEGPDYAGFNVIGPPEENADDEFYYEQDGAEDMNVALSTLPALYAAGSVTDGTRCWMAAFDDWMTLAEAKTTSELIRGTLTKNGPSAPPERDGVYQDERSRRRQATVDVSWLGGQVAADARLDAQVATQPEPEPEQARTKPALPEGTPERKKKDGPGPPPVGQKVTNVKKLPALPGAKRAGTPPKRA